MSVSVSGPPRATTEALVFARVEALLEEAVSLLRADGTRLGWDEYGLAIARTVLLRADCTRRRVGAVILSTENRLAGAGYNGTPSGAPGCLTDAGCPRGTRSYEEVARDSSYVGVEFSCPALHAEENALLSADRETVRGGTIYVSDRPCPNCERLLRGSVLARAVFPGGSLDLDSRST